MAASPFPLADALLSQADAALGFNWLAWFTWVNAHPALHFILARAYTSIPVQALGLLIYFAFVDAKRIDEALLATALSTALIIPGMVLLPAVGAWSQHGVGVGPWEGDILALRSHTLLTIGATQGIVAFPSFHTVLGVVLANMVRGHKWLLPVLVLNALLIVAVITEGAHYGVDMLGGLAVAFITIGASRLILTWYDRKAAAIAIPQPEHSDKMVAARATRSQIFLTPPVETQLSGATSDEAIRRRRSTIPR
jgi:membrane-associated phospholipid phosphatase